CRGIGKIVQRLHDVLGNDFASHRQAPNHQRGPPGNSAGVSGAIPRRDVFGLRRRIPVYCFGRTGAGNVPSPGARQPYAVMSAAPQVAVTGAFDDLRPGTLRFLQESARFGDVTILLWEDDVVRATSGKPPAFPLAERAYCLQSLRWVKSVAPVGVQSN